VTGAPLEPVEYEAMNPSGKAVLKAAEDLPPHEPTTPEYPYLPTTGRTRYHFHTRTKTGRARQLQDAAPDVWVEMSAYDADLNGWSEGDLLRISTPRGRVEARLRISGIRPSTLFLPFHYGYWDLPEGQSGRAANELTVTDWDPCSKQPLFKCAAARAERIAVGDGPSAAPTTTASRPVGGRVPPTRGGADAVVLESIGPEGSER
jgi:anaerobic selenocysteine-containing dehydrogenase